MAWLITRPYITLFLLAFLALASRRLGWPRALLWLATGYGIALLSEASSIRTGFPYGLYAYRADQLGHDPLIFGVPVWDSLSYPFLIYAGWSVARWRNGRGPAWRVALLGALYTMLLDVMIDPVARLGDRWFLGQIYAYAHPGWYFGVPFSNFAGWFLVPWLVITANHALWRLPGFRTAPALHRATRSDLAFYCGIALFNIAIAGWIGAWGIAACSTAILVIIGVRAYAGRRRRQSGQNRGRDETAPHRPTSPGRQ